MAKKSSIEKNNRRRKLAERQSAKRAELRAILRDRSRPAEERFAAVLKLAQMPRNGAKGRVRNRCGLTGRARGYYRKFGLSRIKLRELAATGQIPGVVKASW